MSKQPGIFKSSYKISALVYIKISQKRFPYMFLLVINLVAK